LPAMGPFMLTRAEFTNYRGFRSYKLEGLAPVNLFVGKNNSGKTALLEGLQFLTSGGDAAVLVEVAERRGELVVGPEPSSVVDIAHFFHGHTLNPDTVIQIAGDNGYVPVFIKAFAYTAKNGGGGEQQRRPPRPAGLYVSIISKGLRSERDDPTYRVTRDGGVDFEVSPRFRRMGRRQTRPHVRFVSTDSLNTVALAAMWDEVTLTGQEVDVAAAMRVLEPDLESLHFLTGLFASGYFPARGGIVVGIKGQDGRVPLGSMGDGMRRLMSLATALAFTKEGCLFVDEIDTGLHYSVMADMWKLVISKAIASKVQVFATTHSWDCIEGLSLLCQREPALMASVGIHKIDRAIPHSIAFPGDAVVRMVKADIDPR
jgi:hypothetical protein